MSDLQQVVADVKVALEKKFVFVHMKAPQLETLLAGLEALQEYADDEGMRVSDAIAERDGWEKEVERLRAEHTAMKTALEWYAQNSELALAHVVLASLSKEDTQ